MPVTRRVTRAMASTSNKRRKASFEVSPALDFSLRNPPTPEPAASLPSSFRLTDLPPELGILIASHVDTASAACLTLANKITASWVSKSLLVRVERCERFEEAEALDPSDDPVAVARFVSAVTSVCIPSHEKSRFVSGIMQLHCRPEACDPTLTVDEECGVLREVVKTWSASRQGALLAQYLSSELARVKPISHFRRVPTDPASASAAVDERIFRVLNGVLSLPSAGEQGVPRGNTAGGDTAGHSGGDAYWSHLADVIAELTAEMVPERVATLVHLLLGPNELYMRITNGADVTVSDDWFATFDLDADTAADFAEAVDFKNISEPWEAFDPYIAAFCGFLAHALPREKSRRDEMAYVVRLTQCWSFQFKVALVAALARRDADRFGFLVNPRLDPGADPNLALVLEGTTPFHNPELPCAVFRLFARRAWSVGDFKDFLAVLIAGWNRANAAKLLGRVLGAPHFPGALLVPACECGCTPATLRGDILEKLTFLATSALVPEKVGGQRSAAAERGGEPASPLAPGRAVRAAGETDAFATPSPKTPVVARKG